MSSSDARLSAILPLIKKPCDVFELVAALHQHRDVSIQDVLCSKLYEAKSHEIEFFLPQLWYVRRNVGSMVLLLKLVILAVFDSYFRISCSLAMSNVPFSSVKRNSDRCEVVLSRKCSNIILNRTDAEVEPLWNFILDKCRMSLHLGLLVHFIFQGAVEDQQLLAGQADSPPLSRCKTLLSRCYAVTTNSNMDLEMSHIIRLFTNYQLQKERNRRRVASVASRASMSVSSTSPFGSPLGSPSPALQLNAPSGTSSASSLLTAPISTAFKPVEVSSSVPPKSTLSSSFQSSFSGLGPSVSSGTMPMTLTAASETNPVELDFQDVASLGDETLSSTPVVQPFLRTAKPTPQFTLATEPDLLEPEVDHRPMEAKVAETSPDEFTGSTYRSLIGQFMTPLVESESKFDLFSDSDLGDFETALESMCVSEDYNALGELVHRLVESLPDFAFENPDQANSSVAALSSAMLELEAAYLKVVRHGASHAPASAAPSSLKNRQQQQQQQDTVLESERFELAMDQELILRKYRQRYYSCEWNFIATLTGISSLLKHVGFKTKEQKTKALRICLQEFNAEFARGVYMPILRRKGKTYRVIRIPYNEAFTLNSRDRVPYMMFIEAVTDDDQQEVPDLQITSNAFNASNNTFSSSSPSLSSSIADIDDRNPLGSNSPVVSIRDSEDQKVTKSLQRMEIIDEWVVVDKEAAVVEPPSIVDRIYKESWAKKASRVRKSSPVGNRPGWELISVVMKSGDDLRQEQLATQLIRLFYDIFQRSGLNLWVYPYEVLAVSSQGGFIETIPDALSIHTIKEELGADPSLRNYFNQAYGTRPADLTKAKVNFIESLAAYSLICYILQIKDRHNGNILLDTQGHLIHIDYGFMLTSSPGSLGFENAPFKLTVEFVEVMDGRSSPLYAYFRTLFQSGFLAIRQHHKSILSIVQMMEAGSKMACFGKGPQTMRLLEDRFKIGLSEEEAIKYADDLITYSEGNWRTDSYDAYQALTNGIKV